jgi:hypothetical protein
MPKRLLLALAAAAIAIAACHSNSSTSLPTAVTQSPSPNPSITNATILVTINGTPQVRIPVDQSTPKNPGSPRPGKPFDVKNTNRKGLAHFTGLKPSKTYCWVVSLPPIRFTECAGWAVWQSGTIQLGT